MKNKKCVSIRVDQDPATGGIQVQICDIHGGYHLAGPKYTGHSKNLLLKELNERDAEEIKQYLEEIK